ncbi:hypothetical protein AB0952_29650 [Streptomyces caniferus]|uniref:hypothetical protein n=1 Tax=Streptomyces caniferus TaxID=285557 RepID=UPI003456FC49
MDKGLRRTAGIAVMAAGFGIAAWLVFGAPPAEEDGWWRLVRMAVGLTAMGVVSGGARLFFGQPKSEGDGALGETDADRDSGHRPDVKAVTDRT